MSCVAGFAIILNGPACQLDARAFPEESTRSMLRGFVAKFWEEATQAKYKSVERESGVRQRVRTTS